MECRPTQAMSTPIVAYIARPGSMIARTVIMEIIKTSHGKDKICLDGHMYVQKLSRKEWIRWECVKRRREGCKASFTTDIDQVRYDA